MKHAKFSAILGRDVKVGETLSAEDLAKIEAALGGTTETTDDAGGAGSATPGSETTETTETTQTTEASADPNAALTASITAAVQSAVAPMQNQLTEMSNRLSIVEGKAGADTTTAPVVTGDAKTLQPWEDPNSPINQKIAADLGE